MYIYIYIYAYMCIYLPHTHIAGWLATACSQRDTDTPFVS